jgi:hypothetical protein
MKTRQLLLSILFLFTTIITFAQAQFTNSGIAVQGIARDANNTAIQNQTISLKFTFLYETGTTDVEFKVVDKSIVTDNFGVFSSIIDPGFINNEIFSNKKVFIRINNGTVQLSREPLNVVPYAISANNGVPTGAIMPFIGTAVPTGWALCNGAALPGTATELIAMVGSNAPNLQGTFLRGTGVSVTNDRSGPALRSFQDESFLSHNHTGSISINNNGNHSHALNFTDGGGGKGQLPGYADAVGFKTEDSNGTNSVGFSGQHIHTGSVSINSNGGIETRPVNYGVNYIIKL